MTRSGHLLQPTGGVVFYLGLSFSSVILPQTDYWSLIRDGGCEFEFVRSGADCFTEICVSSHEGSNSGDRVRRSAGNGHNTHPRTIGGKLPGDSIRKTSN